MDSKAHLDTGFLPVSYTVYSQRLSRYSNPGVTRIIYYLTCSLVSLELNLIDKWIETLDLLKRTIICAITWTKSSTETIQKPSVSSQQNLHMFNMRSWVFWMINPLFKDIIKNIKFNWSILFKKVIKKDLHIFWWSQTFSPDLLYFWPSGLKCQLNFVLNVSRCTIQTPGVKTPWHWPDPLTLRQVKSSSCSIYEFTEA